MPQTFRVTRTRNRTFPYAWRCTIPDPSSHTGECGAGAFAATEALVAANHAEHVKTDHKEES